MKREAHYLAGVAAQRTQIQSSSSLGAIVYSNLFRTLVISKKI